MLQLKLVLTCLSLAALTTSIVNVPDVKAYSVAVQEVQIKAKDWFDKGIIKVNEGKYTEALENFTNAINIESRYAEAYYRRGLIYARDANSVKAIADFNQAIQLNPQYTAAYHQRGLLQKNTENKLQDFEMAVNLYYSKLPVYLNENKYEAATKILQSVKEINIAKKNLNVRIAREKTSLEERPIGSSTNSPKSKQSPNDLINEAVQYVGKRDLEAATHKLREAKSICDDKNKKHEIECQDKDVQRMMNEVEAAINAKKKR